MESKADDVNGTMKITKEKKKEPTIDEKLKVGEKDSASFTGDVKLDSDSKKVDTTNKAKKDSKSEDTKSDDNE